MPKPKIEQEGLSSEFSRKRAIIYERVRYSTDILPFSHHHLDREVELKSNSQVDGHVYGRKVEMGMECTVNGIVFGQDWVTVGLRSLVLQGVLSHGSVVLEEGTQVGEVRPGNVIAADVRIGKGCIITGNVIATRSLELSDDCTVNGIVCCIDGPLKIGMGASVRDAMSSGPLTLGASVKVMDDVIWSRTSISAGSVEMDSNRPGRDDQTAWNGQEVNMNLKRLASPKVDRLTVDEQHHKSARDILTHRRIS